jgi:phosphatidylinositol-3-phosphatase
MPAKQRARAATRGCLVALVTLLAVTAPVAARKKRSGAGAPSHQSALRRPLERRGHTISHVVWILMENKDYSSVIGSGAAPYINHLAHDYGLATRYSAISHPSLPNYIALTSGGTQGISDDCGASRSLEQGMPSRCATNDSGNYAVRHNPEAYYTNVRRECSSSDVPFGAKPDLQARFTLVTPNLVDDMHDGSVADGNRFLQHYVPALMATPQYRARNTVIFIVWDENEGAGGNRVPCIVISPFTHGVRDSTSYSHYSLLRTTEALLGLPFLGGARSAHAMVGRFGF